jgi:hypothetical protein
VAAAALIEEDHVPLAGTADSLALRLKPGRVETQKLGADLGEVALEVGGHRERRRIVPRPARQVGIDHLTAAARGLGEPLDITGEAIQARPRP